MNGDGLDDLVVGAWKDDDGGSDSGSAVVIFGVGTSCADADECALGTHDCPASANCINTDGSFTC
eukprot:3444100-Rhodomonas_salina.1